MTETTQRHHHRRRRLGGFFADIFALLGLTIALVGIGALLLTTAPAHAQMPAQMPAKRLFGAEKLPADLPARSFGSYARGCLAGGAALPITGDAWQAMRIERNRNWGHPVLIDYLQRLARTAKAKDGWPGLLVGDLAQPRGGPMLTGHASHQIGLDADIWLRPMPERVLSAEERNEKAGWSAISMLAADKLHADPKKFTDAHKRLIRRAASYAQVARIFVHPALKKALCDWETGHRTWLNKVRPWYGHHYHFHVRLKCPASSGGCVNQKPPPAGDGCGKPVDDWIAMLARPKPKPQKKPKPRPELTLANLPAACQDVLSANHGVAGGPGGVSPTALSAIANVPLPTPRPRLP